MAPTTNNNNSMANDHQNAFNKYINTYLSKYSQCPYNSPPPLLEYHSELKSELNPTHTSSWHTLVDYFRSTYPYPSLSHFLFLCMSVYLEILSGFFRLLHFIGIRRRDGMEYLPGCGTDSFPE